MKTHTEIVQQAVREFLDTPESYLPVSPGTLEYWSTTKNGTHVVHVMPDRRVKHVGVIWDQLTEKA